MSVSINLDASSVMFLGIIGCLGSLNHQIPSPRWLSRGWSSPGLCPGSATPPMALLSWSKASNFCCLGRHLHGPSSTGPCEPQHVAGPAEGVASEPSESHLNGLTPHLPPVTSAFCHLLSVLCPLCLVGLPNVVLPGNDKFKQNDLLGDFHDQHHVRP